MLKEAILELKEELEKLAEENEKSVHEKCARVLLAASGLDLLKKKLTKTSSEDSNV